MLYLEYLLEGCSTVWGQRAPNVESIRPLGRSKINEELDLIRSVM